MAHFKDHGINFPLFSMATFMLIAMHISLDYSNVIQNPVHRVTNCPQNDTEWKKASRRLNCTDDDAKSVNRYHCLPNSELSTLLEFCYSQTRTLVEEGNCMQLVSSIHILNNYRCDQFDTGCPDIPYFSDKTYNYLECVEIDPENHCYLAEPSCKTTTSKYSSRYTISSSYEETSSKSSTAKKEDEEEKVSIIAPIILTILLLIAIFVGIFCWKLRVK
ncbi:uncharacterized protein LOC133190612 [Saccostrea echinata]|uniref:uncharacterized protein LOC133190612 n=1 Tax=Saccostrea echinata TaxID=191078 RepID=UPI002A8097D5|nr:uncharacterized protein LOC133190612 [Saccostrea echinata]